MARKPVCNRFGFPHNHTIIALRKAIPLGSCFVADYVNPFGFDPREVCDFFDSYISYLQELIEENGKKDDNETFSEYDNDENIVGWLNCFGEPPFSIRLPQQTAYYGYGFSEWIKQFDEAKARKEEREREKQARREAKVA